MTAHSLRLPKRHFHVLDLSRMIAAVAVLFWHYLHFTIPVGRDRAPPNFIDHEPLSDLFRAFYAHGHLAVEYFWIVSGFVFAHVYLADARGWRRFWLARFARLWPLHLLTLMVVAGLNAVYWAQHGRHFVFEPNDLKHFVLNLGLAHYWGFEDGMTFNGPSWSLSVEIVAYAAFCLLLPALRARREVIASAATLAAALLAAKYPEIKIFACLAYFFAGTTIYLAWLRVRLRPAAMSVLGGASVAAAIVWEELRGFDFPNGALWVLGLFLLTLAADAADRADRLTIGKRWGDASYGTYLWHFPIQLMLVMLLDRLPGGRALAEQPAFLALYLALAIGAGFASHRWFEVPAQRAILGFTSRRASGRAAFA